MDLFYRKYGKGPALVILHGLYGSSDNWVSFARSVADNFKVYLPDLRNHGSSPHSEEHDYDVMSRDIEQFIISTGEQKVILAGHSMGGKVAATLALKNPGLLNALVIIDIEPFGSEMTRHNAYLMHQSILSAIKSVNLPELNKREEIDSLLSASISDSNLRAFLLKNLKRDASGKNFSWKINVEILLKNLDKITGDIPINEHDIFVTGYPVIFIKAENSDYITEPGFRKALKVFPAAELRTVPDAGHWVNADNPMALAGIITGLLNN